LEKTGFARELSGRHHAKKATGGLAYSNEENIPARSLLRQMASPAASSWIHPRAGQILLEATRTGGT
jgi:hypothetical protein